MKSPQWHNLAKKKLFLDLQRNHPSAVLLRLGYVLEVGLVSQLDLVLIPKHLCSWRYKFEYVSVSRTYDLHTVSDQ